MEWVVLLRPLRVLLLLAFMLGCKVAAMLSVGPVFVLVRSIVDANGRNGITI